MLNFKQCVTIARLAEDASTKEIMRTVIDDMLRITGQGYVLAEPIPEQQLGEWELMANHIREHSRVKATV
jgi:hypothetical protein